MYSIEDSKMKIMLHRRSNDSISGISISNNIICNSFLNTKYSFSFLEHAPQVGIKNNILVIPRLIKQIKKINPDIVHIAGLSRSGFEAVVAARLCGRKTLLTIHGSSIDAIDFNKKFLYAHIIEPLTLRMATKVYTVCNAMANRSHIKKHTKHNFIGTIHNSAPIVELDKIESFHLRQKLNIDENAVVVAIVGRMTYDKGITYIVEAINDIKDKNIVFVFIGDGGIIDDIQKSIPTQDIDTKVFFMGKQSNVLSILKECDIFLFATLHENLSNALLEACSMGLAVIATNVGGNPEVIQDNKNGILIPPANAEKIKEAVTYLADNRDLRIQLGRQALNTIKTRFSQDDLLNKLENVYNSMLLK